MDLSEIKYNCRHFEGDIPCLPNKVGNKVCNNCDEYDPVSKRILIIKLGAIGDVIRTTPLIHRFREYYPECHITWITNTPDILPRSVVDKILKFDFRTVYGLIHQKFDIAVNLDKDIEACSLISDISAHKKLGFTLKYGFLAATNKAAEQKLLTGMFDNLSKENSKSYLQEIFEICEFEFRNEPYILDPHHEFDHQWKQILNNAGQKKIIGLNTGCGKRWLTRLWPDKYWIELINRLQEQGFFPLLLGGADEDTENIGYAEQTGAYYPGTFTLPEFISLTNCCDLVVTAVTMMMHIAIGLKKPLVLFNNIFNRNEFELYNNGIIVEPDSGCDCYFGNTCKRERHCMLDLPVEKVFSAIIKLVNK